MAEGGLISDAAVGTARPARLAIVGHTNTGKTSLVRTLTRDTGFGHVSPEASTTRHVERVRLLADGEPLVELYDTPGLEDPIELLHFLHGLVSATGERLDGPARVETFLASHEAHGRFEQEAKVMRQLLASDAGIYVIDARDPVLAKHRDELVALNFCGKPLLPVLNFVASPDAQPEAWREAMHRSAIHLHVNFDAVAPEQSSERVLYEKLAAQLERFQGTLRKLVECRERDARVRHEAAMQAVADMLIDVAAAAIEIPLRAKRPTPEAARAFGGKVIERERACVESLLGIYRFSDSDLEERKLPIVSGYWDQDPFDPAALKALGIGLSKGVGAGAAGGAAAGAAVDAIFGGLTLGAGAVIGGVVGGGTMILRKYWPEVSPALRGAKRVLVNDGVLRLLLLRQLYLVKQLESRGHASVTPVEEFVEASEAVRWQKGALPATLQKARTRPDWSRLNGELADGTGRLEVARKLRVEFEAGR